METYDPTSGSPLDFQDVPAIELDCNQLELDDSESGQEAESDLEKESSEPTIRARDSGPTNQPDTDGVGTSEVWGEPIPPKWSSSGRNGDRNTRLRHISTWQWATHPTEGISLREA